MAHNMPSDSGAQYVHPPANGLTPAVLTLAQTASLAFKAAVVTRLTDWVNAGAPQLPAGTDEFSWFLSKRAKANIDKWLADKKLAVLTPTSFAGTGRIVVSYEAVEHCRASRAAEGVSQAAVIELLIQLFVRGNPSYAPNTSKGQNGKGYVGQLVMFDANYKSLDNSALGESACAILQHDVSELDGAPFVQLRLVTAYWTKPKSLGDLRGLEGTFANGGAAEVAPAEEKEPCI